jgi:hypothetical protein
MTVSGMNAAPVIDDDVGAKFANDADHVLENLAVPDFLCFFRGFRETKIAGAREIEFDAVAARGGEQFLRADEAELGGLFRAERILAAFAASEGEKGDVGMKAAGKIGEHGSGFVVGMSGDIEDAGGDARAVDGFHSFRKARACAGSGRKLGVSGEREEAGEDDS